MWVEAIQSGRYLSLKVKVTLNIIVEAYLDYSNKDGQLDW